MREPEELLRSLPPESPPPEVVTAAMRVFRYRAIAAVALACALVLSAVILKSKVDKDSRLLERIASSRYTGGVVEVVEVRHLDGLEVTLWELVIDDAPTSFVHVLATDERGRDFTLAISRPRVDDRPTSVADLEGSGGGSETTYAQLWQEIRLPAPPGEIDDLSFNVDVVGDEVSGSIPFEINL